MKKLLWIITGVVIVGLMLMPGRADAISYDLNTVIDWETGNVTNTPVSSVFPGYTTFGTISFTDNGTNVDISVNLVGNGIHKVQSIYFNFNDSMFSNSDNFDTTSSDGILVGENTLQADGYSAGFFDLCIPLPPPGNLGFEPYSTSITLTGVNLDPSYFASTDSSGVYFAAVHIGNLGSNPGEPGDDSIWVGASVPDASIIFLLGPSLIALGVFSRKKSRK